MLNIQIKSDVLEKSLLEAKRRGNAQLQRLLEAVKEDLEKNIDNLQGEIQELLDNTKNEAKQAIEEATEVLDKSVHPYYLVQKPSKTLVIHCGDSRFQDAFHGFLQEKVGLEESYNLIVFPGATQILTFGELLPKFTNSLLRPVKFLVKRHNLKRIIVIMHEDCGWYKDFVPQFLTINEKTLQERQMKDLRKTRELLHDLFPEIETEIYYAVISNNGQVEFRDAKEKI